MKKTISALSCAFSLLATPALADQRMAGFAILGGGYRLSPTVSNDILLRVDSNTHGVAYPYQSYDRDILNKPTPGYTIQENVVYRNSQTTAFGAWAYTQPIVGSAFTDTKGDVEFKFNHKMPTPYSGFLAREDYVLRHVFNGPGSASILSTQIRYYFPISY